MAISHQSFSGTSNDTDAILVSGEAELDLYFVNVLKTGYSTNLVQASFFGVNAAINVQNGSTALFPHMNITTNNGAAKVYSYGTGSIVNIMDSFLYSSGRVAHGLYIYGKNVWHYSSGVG